MDEGSVKIQVARTILRRGVWVPVCTAPLLLRWLGVKNISFRMRQPSLGGLIMISEIVAAMGVKPEDLNELTQAEALDIVRKNGRNLSRIVMIGILRYWPLVHLNRSFSWLLVWAAEPAVICAAAHILMTINDTGDFINTIRSITLKMSYLSPKNQGSQEAE